MLSLRSTHLVMTVLIITEVTSLSVPSTEPKLVVHEMKHFISKSADDNQVIELTCPIDRLILCSDTVHCDESSRVQSIKKQLLDLISVRWKKDDRPFTIASRPNGIPYERRGFNLVLFNVGESDEGAYSCIIDYTKVPYELGKHFKLFEGGAYDLEVIPPTPNTLPYITNPPDKETYVELGQKVVLPCHRTDTILTQTTVWFKSCSSLHCKNCTCIEQFLADYNTMSKGKDLSAIVPYQIELEDGNQSEFIIENFTDADIGYYGCLVFNDMGSDAKMGLVDLAENHPKLQARVEYVKQQQSDRSHEWIWFLAGFVGFSMVALIIASCICIFKAKLQRGKKQANPPLLSQMAGIDASNNKDPSSRKRLPTIEAPDIYNTGKSLDGFITGHFHQEAGQIMAQSICGNLLNKVNPSISSSNSHQSDEASSSWGKSSHGDNFRTLYSHGDNSRAFYSHGSNSTATTVPLYDHPPSTGTLRRCRTFVRDACVSNPSYWLLNPENDTTEWNFPRRNLDRLDKIGEGQFGEVWRYIARSRDGADSIVAVKKLKDDRASISERAELRAEIEIMKVVNKHPNVIKLLHCCIDESGPILLIMEYAENGKLQTYLRSCRATRKLYSDRDEKLLSRQNVTSKELIKFTYHIAKGMEYVASQGIVHRDLASRNILVSKDKVCKVADFGFARRVDDDCVYVRKSTNPVPVKWMAPEALEENKFTLKSDVFSLGILMWEIVTLGATPYEQMGSEEVYKKVTTGGRLERPQHCKDEFFTLMEQCWTHDPALRPTFKEVAQKLERLLLSENDYIELDQYPEHAYYNIVNTAEKEVVRITI